MEHIGGQGLCSKVRWSSGVGVRSAVTGLSLNSIRIGELGLLKVTIHWRSPSWSLTVYFFSFPLFRG